MNIKKILGYSAAACALMLASCSNEDVPVSQAVSFRVNPNTVVSGFEEYSGGELSVLADTYDLRVRLLIYNESGSLVSKSEELTNDYNHTVYMNANLEPGSYKVIALTDVVADENTFEYWSLADEEKLSTATVTDCGYIGGKYKLLGLRTLDIDITENQREVAVDVYPAGALAIVRFMNWNRYSDVSDFYLLSNRSCDDMRFDENGNPIYSVESSRDYDWILSSMEWDSNYSGGYSYVFMFPIDNMSLRFYAMSTADKLYGFGSATVNIEAGREYYFAWDVTNDTYDWQIFNTKSEPAGFREMTPNKEVTADMKDGKAIFKLNKL